MFNYFLEVIISFSTLLFNSGYLFITKRGVESNYIQSYYELSLSLVKPSIYVLRNLIVNYKTWARAVLKAGVKPILIG